MHIQENISLKPYNTFDIDAKASYFVVVTNTQQLQDVLALEGYPKPFILGGGSNMLLTKDLDALVIHVNIKGIEIVSETENEVLVKANAGENWHEFVQWCLAHNFGGVENLSLIPGNVGTAPIQNIGAYGVELKDVFQSCKALHIKDKAFKTFTKPECHFGYRESVFKQAEKGNYIITSVSFKLTKNKHIIRTDYGAILAELKDKNIETPTIQEVSKAIIAIRESKLPDPKKIGNSGSFFKNPVINKMQFKALLKNFPEAPSYVISEDEIKVPAGWLIETSGFKGKTFSNYGVHKKQALVLVNYSDAKGQDILNLAHLIQDTVWRLFDIRIETEVNII